MDCMNKYIKFLTLPIVLLTFILVGFIIKKEVSALSCECVNNVSYCYNKDVCNVVTQTDCCEGSGCLCDFFCGKADPSFVGGEIYCCSYTSCGTTDCCGGSSGSSCGNDIVETGEDCEKDSQCDDGYECNSCECEQSAYCGDGNVDSGEECEKPGDSCTYDSKSGTCTTSCDCCVRCSLSCNYPVSSTVNRFLFNDLYTCTDRSVCPDPQSPTIDCYEIISPAPVPSFLIHPESYKTLLGFTSGTHTGGGEWIVDNQDDRVNDFIPVKDLIVNSTADEFYMQATFTDTDQVIEAMYVWFSQSTSTPITPKAYGGDTQADKTATRTGFGFMLRKNGTDWIPYIPSIVGAGDGLMDIWSPAVYSSTEKIFSIKSPDGDDMVNVQLDKGKILVTDSGKTVTFQFSISMKQRDGKNLIEDLPDQGKYNVFLLANDVFGFTPYDNYDCTKYPAVCTAIQNLWLSNKRIRYYGNSPDLSALVKWRDTSIDWNIDLDSPVVDLEEVKVENRSQIKYEWTISDTFAVYGVVGNYFISSDAKDVSTFEIDGISPAATRQITTFIPQPLDNDEVVIDNDIIGHLDDTAYATNKFIFKIVNGAKAGTLLIDPGETRKGIVSLYITAFDLAGNYHTDSITFDLSDWMATQGGLLYSADGTDVNSRELSLEALALWNNAVKDTIGNFMPEKSDVTTELVADKLTLLPTAPLKSDIVDSYMIRPYNVVGEITSYYSILKTSFEKRSTSFPIKQIPDNGNPVVLSGDLFLTSPNLVVLDTDKNVEVGTSTEPFRCNGEGVFFVGGNLIIKNQILNGDPNKDACIFVVRGNVIVQPGAHVSSDIQIRYDQINAYILADGEFTINEETDTVIKDPLYIGGGVHSIKGVTLERYLKLGDRLVFPVFIVNHHSKYGVLAGKIFGTAVNLQKVEVGFKP